MNQYTKYPKQPIERFNEKWELDADGCHIWTEGTRSTGYGGVRIDGRIYLAHRWLYQHVHKLSDEQMPPEVCHTCDKPLCVREQCLFPGTHQDNMDDRQAKGRYARKLTDVDVLEIREEYAKGVLTQYMLADAYGVSQGQISACISGRQHAHARALDN